MLNAEDFERHLSIREVAQRLGCSSSAIRNYCRARLIESVKLPGKYGKVLIPVSAVVRMLNEHRLPARDEIASLVEI